MLGPKEVLSSRRFLPFVLVVASRVCSPCKADQRSWKHKTHLKAHPLQTKAQLGYNQEAKRLEPTAKALNSQNKGFLHVHMIKVLNNLISCPH